MSATCKADKSIQRRRVAKQLHTIATNPAIIHDAIAKQKQTLKDNPDVITKRTIKQKQTLKDNPDIIAKRTETIKNVLRNNPDIVKRRGKKISEIRRVHVMIHGIEYHGICHAAKQLKLSRNTVSKRLNDNENLDYVKLSHNT